MLFKTPKAELRNGLLELRDNVHPKPLTDSGLETLASSGSCHRAKAAAFYRTKGSSRRTSWPKNQPRWPTPFAPQPLQPLYH